MVLQLILGNQLFPTKFYKDIDDIFMCEDSTLCTRFKYHKHKIIFFLASMRNFRDELIHKGKKVDYTTLDENKGFFNALKEKIKKDNIFIIQAYEIEDKFFEEELKFFCLMNGVKLVIKTSPNFLVTRDNFKVYLHNHKNPFMKTFYENLRKDTGILMDPDGKPSGGKFSFDQDNRKKIPKKFDVIKNILNRKFDNNTLDVIKLVDKHFADHPGDTKDFWLCVTRKDALKEFENFLKNKLENFGAYEDAIDARDPFLYHSVLSPYINIGFLNPDEIVKKILKTDSPINSKEGFIRQIIGWREFIRGIYQNFSQQQENSNFFRHKRKLTQAWYKGETGIKPLDDAIKKTNEFGYNHHIERLMIISNLMLLCEIKPKYVYCWFMEMYVDSSDWVMVPNVYGMAQFSDGGIFATKPYIAGSNYILKMSHYKKDDWCDTMDGLYWRFIDRHREYFVKNHRMSMMVNMLDKIPSDRKETIFSAANSFLDKFTDI